MLVSKEHHSYLEALRPLIEARKVTPAVDTTYPLADVPDAMRHLTAGHARGKIAITI
jgi:NADPH:quinone reductase-like Zn-dependent oxidoreductase